MKQFQSQEKALQQAGVDVEYVKRFIESAMPKTSTSTSTSESLWDKILKGFKLPTGSGAGTTNPNLNWGAK